MALEKTSTPILQSLTRPILIMGGERENIILLACVCLSLCTVGRDFLSVILAVVLWMAGLVASKMVARIDPWATKIFVRSLQYRDFYRAREKILTPKSILQRSRKF